MITDTYDFTSLLTHVFNTSFVDMTCDLGRGTFGVRDILGWGTFGVRDIWCDGWYGGRYKNFWGCCQGGVFGVIGRAGGVKIDGLSGGKWRSAGVVG